MIISGFDGTNVSLALNPRQLKILYHALDMAQADKTVLEATSAFMRQAGYDMSSEDVGKYLGQAVLEVKEVCVTLRKAVPQEESNDNESNDATSPQPTKRVQ